MSTELIIQRLLDEKHITAEEAMQMLKDLVANRFFRGNDSISIKPKKIEPIPNITCMYACVSPINPETSNVFTTISSTDSNIK